VDRSWAAGIQRGGDQDRLEEQADQPGLIAVEAECVGVLDVLRDVAGKITT
jgi:hypothetical protein